jgi:hypothetical protein
VFRFSLFPFMLAFAVLAAGQSPSPGLADPPVLPFLAEIPAQPLPERYDVLVVDKTQFLKTQVEFGQTATFPAYTEDLLRVEWRPDDPIDVSIVKPNGIPRPPVVIFLYGYGTDPEKFLNPQFCATLAAKGFAAVGFQTALTGPRYHDRPLKEWFVSELPESIGASVHDVQLMIDYLQTRDDLDTSRIGIFGQGSGGAVSILAAVADRRIKAVDVMNPWGDWPDWLANSPVVPDEERAGYTSSEFLEKVKPLDPLRWMEQLEERPFRLQETLFDSATPDNVRKKMQEALPRNAQFASYPDPDSYRVNVSRDGRMLAWMQDQLGISRVQSDLLLSTK